MVLQPYIFTHKFCSFSNICCYFFIYFFALFFFFFSSIYVISLMSVSVCNRERRSSGLDNNNDVCNIDRVWEEVLLACRRVSFVGHNCMMDLMFLSSQFESLPPNYYEFKEMASMFHFGFFFFSMISLLLTSSNQN
jgi:hypothetical protein